MSKRRHPADPFAGIVDQIEGEVGRFHVQSRTRNLKHLVDILDGPFGYCSCENQLYEKTRRQRAALQRKRAALGDFCWHLKCVWGWMGWMVAKELRKQAREREAKK